MFSAFVLLPRITSQLQWFLGYLTFCSSGTNYIILTGVLASNFLHIVNVGNSMSYPCSCRKYFFLSTMIPPIIMDTMTCFGYVSECIYPSLSGKYLFTILNMSSILFNVIPNILLYSLDKAV